MILLKGGHVVDGTGAAGFDGDVLVRGDRIAEIGRGLHAPEAEVVDCAGLVVAPGFVDLHTHSDFTLMADGRAESQVHQGVTTEVIGQCGISCAPVCDRHQIPHVSPWWTAGAEHPGWESFADYLAALDGTGLGVNVAAFVGHGTIHRKVMGTELRAGEPDEVAAMAREVARALEEGAAGVSSGLEYFPGSLAAPEHLVPLVAEAATRGRLYATHVRNRDTSYDLGFAEAISTARQAGAKLQISHIQPKFGAPGHAMHHTLEMIEAGRRAGADIAFDVIPHDWNHTLMAAILPKWAQAGGPDAVLARLADPEARARIKANPQPMWLIVKARRWSEIVLLSATENRDLVGADFAEIARMRGLDDPYDAVLDILSEEGGNLMGCLWSSKSFREDDIELCLSQPDCAVISDTVATAPDGILSEHVGSLSGYGWAARFLQHYVRDRGVLGLEDGVRRITSVPADRLGLRDRGRLAVGMAADVVAFDPEGIAMRCSAKHPRRYAAGVAEVLVNGARAMAGGVRRRVEAGRVLRPA